MERPRLISNLPRHEPLRVQRGAVVCEGAPRAVVHDHASVALYLEGEATLWVGGSYRVGARDLVLIPEGAPHMTRGARGVRLVGASICGACLAEPGGEPLRRALEEVSRGGVAVRALSEAAAARVDALFVALGEEMEAVGAPGHALARSALLALLAVEVQRASPRARVEGASGQSALVLQVLAIIHEVACEGGSLTEVSRRVGRSAAHVAEVVRAETGQTVGEWVLRARMGEARLRLSRTEEAVEEVAARVGFSSGSHFYRAFRRVHGLTPGQWRRLHRQG